MKRKPRVDENVELCRKLRADFDKHFASLDEMFDFLIEQDQVRRRREGRSTRIRKTAPVHKAAKSVKTQNKH
jgi:hypothetical protein